MHSTVSCLGGRATSPMGRIGRHSGVSTTTSMSACAISSRDGTRLRDVAQTRSPTTLSMGNGRCCASDAYLFLARRHKIKGRGTNRFSYNVVYGERALLRLERLPWSL